MYGGGTAAALANTQVYDELSLPFGVYGTDGYIDNNWMSLWGEVGTLGLAMYLWLYIALFVACLVVYRDSEDKDTRALALGVCAAMIAVGLNAFLATFLEVRTLAPYLWTMAGVVIALGQREKVL
jgi:O-antigen ligase